MTDRRLFTLLIVSLIVSLGAGIAAFRMLGRVSSMAPPSIRTVVVAAADIPEGQVFEKGDLTTVKLPSSGVPEGAHTVVDSLIGRIPVAPIFRGEAIVEGRLAPIGSEAGLEIKIPYGKRGMAVKIDEVSGLSGLVQPNSRVDVLVTIAGSESSRSESKLFMSNVRVLSMGSQVERGPDGAVINASTATLEVTPEEAERLAVASNMGKIQLALRGYGDPDVVKTDGATVRGLLSSEPVREEPEEPPQRPARRETPRPRPAPAREVVAMPAATPRSQVDTSVVRVYRRDQPSTTTLTRRTARDTGFAPTP